MDSMFDNLAKTEFISVFVGNPKLQKRDPWHTHIDYEICLHTNSMCFRKKSSTVRRRYREFVWLRRCLEQNALIIEIPKLPPWNPFFSLRNAEQVRQRMKGLQEFLEIVLHSPLLLSDSRLHLFLQSDLSVNRMQRCAVGRTRYTVAEAIQRFDSGSIDALEDKASCDSDCESSSSSGLGLSVDCSLHGSTLHIFDSPDRDAELCTCDLIVHKTTL
ncbi:sorting nexin-10A [Corythoichthys intestinalis]|uniref:sorting nexin-10A n=1 Tax=Corythoichthys intestinalis TaxID=161448 RepID=UPI0025A546B6|nr:sorting nexin-10A [Corythoichthys intestinalis]XP_057683943.1 sorting nexin-10A [Corythoichthys intestinalis]